MAKDKLTDYSATAGSNTEIGGININEGMLPSNVNNALREQMSHLADFAAGTSGVDVLKLQDDTDTNSIKIQAPASVTTSTTFTLPDGDGSANQSLVTNGSGALSFSTRLANVVEDATPSLGGNLDTNGNDISFGDNDKATFGDAVGGDLQIFHDSNASYIVDSGTGSLNIHGTDINLRDADGNSYINMSDNGTGGTVTLKHNTATKLTTKTDGILITGELQADTLDINGAADIAGTLTADGLNVEILDNDAGPVTIQQGGNSYFKIVTTNSSESVQLGNSTTNPDILLGGGNVGIGTTSPSVALQVKGANTPIISQSTSTGAGPNILKFIDSASTDLGYVGYGATNKSLYLVNFSADPIIFYNGSEAMRIDSDGKVGIGTSSPTASKLQVDGTDGTIARFRTTSGANNTVVNITSSDAAGTAGFSVGGNASFPAMTFENGGTEAMRIDSSGNVGIGTTLPSTKLHLGGTAPLDSIIRQDSTVSGTNWEIGEREAGKWQIFEDDNDSVVATFESNGNLLMGTGTFGNVNSNSFGFSPSSKYAAFSHANGTASGTGYISFGYNTSEIGSITQSGTTGVAYNTSSDYRLKENVTATWDATTRLKQLNPVRFNFIADADTTVDGFLAHEVQDIVPEAITGTKDAMRDEEYEVTPAVFDEDGNEITPAVMSTRSVPDYQGIDQSKLVPLLVKTIQELEARIAALEAN